MVQLLFRETSSGQRLSNWRRYIQVEAVQQLITAWSISERRDYHAYVTQALLAIQQRVRNAGGDAATRAHYKDLDMRIKLALEKK